ncbi:hypothetical protein ACLB2K_022517 [Fragaria x ananassa]
MAGFSLLSAAARSFPARSPKTSNKINLAGNWKITDSPGRESGRGRYWSVLGWRQAVVGAGGWRTDGRPHFKPSADIFIRSPPYGAARGRASTPADSSSFPDHFPSPASPPNSSFPVRSPKTLNLDDLAGKLEFGGLTEDGKWSGKLLESAGAKARPRRTDSPGRESGQGRCWSVLGWRRAFAGAGGWRTDGRPHFKPSADVRFTSGLLEDKVALITGGSSGIGESTTRLFSKHGAKVVIADMQGDLGRSVCNELNPSSTTFVHCDVTNEKEVENAVNTATAKYGKLDIMFNNAGIADEAKPSILDNDKAEFEKVLRVNLVGVLLGTKHATRVMMGARRRNIINTASICSVVGGGATHAYMSSKNGVVGLTKNTAVELRQYGTRVNCVSPCMVASGGAKMRMSPGLIIAYKKFCSTM